MERASTAGVYLNERKDRLLEDVRILRVVVGAAFEGRLDRVNDRVEDYRRLLERRQSEEKKKRSPPRGRPGALRFDAGRGRTLGEPPDLSKLVKHQCG